MDNQIEIPVESLIPNTNANAHLTDHQRRVNTLHKAALKGDWKAAERTVSLDKNIAWNIKITKEGNTALHIAVSAKQTAFVRNLVECLKESELELKNEYGYTAFCTAAVSGVVEIAKVMYHKNKNLPTIRSKSGYNPVRSKSGYTPLKIAIWFRNTEMAEYLYPITPLAYLGDKEYMDILVEAIRADMYGMKSFYFKETHIKLCFFFVQLTK
ncbi:ankyrin-1-like [Olea europaea var. sylvestris]|uniref:ankyrin-1-like n=1 Tax=Olea europaea var. sylvestris TaxID=158386 RepID=UPI000C1D3B53|nr:ankyrin-1-like [Olea europaea var. sylvestris]